MTKDLKLEKFYSEYFWTTLGFKILFKDVINYERFIIYLYIYMLFIYIKLKRKFAEIFSCHINITSYLVIANKRIILILINYCHSIVL